MKLAPGTPLHVSLHTGSGTSTPVGRLAMASGLAQLEWAQIALDTKHKIDPLLYPLEPGLLSARTRDFDGLHGFLADSLPDAWGELLVRRRLAKQGFALADLTAVDRLALVGRAGRGALVFEPATLDYELPGALDLDQLASQAQAILIDENADVAEALAALARGSGGARPKVHVGFSSDGLVYAGDQEPAPDLESWIVKFRAPGDPEDIGPLEEAYARMAREAGISVSETRLLSAERGNGYFATRRFDRPGGDVRLHMVSLAGAVEAVPHMPSLEYDGFLRATFAITRDVRDVEQAFRRMVFNVLAHNRDDHTRQHAFLMNGEGVWRLAPAFDLTFSGGPGGEHYLAVDGEGRVPNRGHVENIGKRHGFTSKVILSIIDDVRLAIGHWSLYADEAGVTNSLSLVGDRLKAVDEAFLS